MYLERKIFNLDVYPRRLDLAAITELNPKFKGMMAVVRLTRRRLVSLWELLTVTNLYFRCF